jgi:tetratricopeptide (TPR) repeat protein
MIAQHPVVRYEASGTTSVPLPFLRARGHQLAILHGTRAPDTSAVDQKTLFTFYSRAEAEAAIGTRSQELKALLEERHPQVRFDWPALRKAIGEQLHALPETYDYAERSRGRFEDGLRAFTRELLIADPRMRPRAGPLVEAHRHELQLLAWLIGWRLQTASERDDRFTAFDEFHWRFDAPADGVSPDAEEHAAALYERGRYDEAAAAFRLFVACFPDYAEGHHYLGLIALEQDRLDDAIAAFRATVTIGRKLFPKRIPKDAWWSDLATRPYMCGLRSLAGTLDRAGHHDEALEVCARLERECYDDLSADAYRATIYMNLGRFAEAGERAGRLVGLWPSECFIAGFALAEARDPRAQALLVRAVLHHPRAALAITGGRVPAARNHEEWRDDEVGRTLLRGLAAWLRSGRRPGLRLLRQILKAEPTKRALAELQDAVAGWRRNERAGFERMTELREPAFAETLARGLAATV